MGTLEHWIHVRHRRDIPCAYVWIKFICVTKHPLHISHRWSIPFRNIPLKISCTPCSKSISHTRHSGNVPRWHWPVYWGMTHAIHWILFQTLTHECLKIIRRCSRNWVERWRWRRGRRWLCRRRWRRGERRSSRRRRWCRPLASYGARGWIGWIWTSTIESLVEFGCPIEHTSWVIRTISAWIIPRCDVLVERDGVSEHFLEISNFRYIPFTDIAVEVWIAVKHSAHSCHLRSVPTPDILIEL